MEEKQFSNTQFKYTCLLNEGEEIRIVGNKEELGNWDYNISKKLHLTKNNTWVSDEKFRFPINTTIEYKYVIFKNDQFLKWEELPYNVNRKVFIPDKLNIFIIDKENESNSKVEEKLRKRKESTPVPKGKQKIFLFGNEGKRFSLKPDEFILEDEYEEPIENLNKYNDLNYESSEENNENIQKKNKQIQEKIDINDSDDIIICSFYLPYNPVKNSDGNYELKNTNDPLNHNLNKIVSEKKNIKWFGMLKNTEYLNEEQKNDLIEKLKEKNFYVFDIEKKIFDNIKIFFLEILEPIFHYVSLNPSYIEDFSQCDIYWESYKKFSEMFCDFLMQYLNNDSIVFLNDYHFFLIPSYLYSKISKKNQTIFQHLSIGLFMHTPFPSTEIFKKIPFRKEIIKSMLNCSVIGFHTFDYSRNFIKTAKRLLQINYESTINGDLALEYFGRTALLRVKNATPEISFIEDDIKSDEFKKYYHAIKDKYKDKTIYASLDHLKFLASIKNKLEGYRQFLRELGDDARNNIYIQYIRYSTEVIDKEGNVKLDDSQKEILEKINNLTKEIKEEFGEDSIEVIQRKVVYKERLALFASANCFIRTSKQESFSLGLYEFLILKDLLKETSKVSYIISELSGINTSLAGTIKINPFDYYSIYNGFVEANQQMFGEKENITLMGDFEHVKKSSCKKWFYDFLKDIKNTKISEENTYYLGVGEGLNFKLMKLNSDFTQLDTNLLIPIYNKSQHRLIFLDYEGTLPSVNVSNENEILKGNKPTKEILHLLSELTQDKRNSVFIITGRGILLLNEWFSKIKDLYLAAEYGFKYKLNTGKEKDIWKRILKDYNNDWMNVCYDIIEPYTERCEGSFLEIKESSIVWQYSECDQELGKNFASVLTSELEYSVKNLNLKVVNGKGYVEVSAYGINKGYFISYIIKVFLSKNLIPDFIICFGDDTSDEKMFHYLKKKKKEIEKYCKNIKIITCTIGKKPSEAHYYVNNPKSVQEVIEEMVKNSKSLPSHNSQENLIKKVEIEE